MAINTYGIATAGNPTNVYQFQGALLRSADAVVVLDKVCKTIRIPRNKNQVVSLLRAVTPDPNVNEVAEGVNPTTRALTYEQVTKTYEEFAESFAVSSRQAELGEMDVLMDSKDRLRDLMVRTREKNGWFEFRAGNNVVFNSSAHTLRTQVNGAISGGRLRIVSRLLAANRAPLFREMTKGSVNIGTTPVEPSYVVLCHTDCRSDIRNLPGITLLPMIGGLKDALPQAFAQWEDFLFVTSPEFEPVLAGGAAVGVTGMKSAGGISADVYSYVCIGREALGKCNLLGSDSDGGMGGFEIYTLTKADKSDPTNQRRYVSARMWDAPVVLNQNWAVSIECGATANPA